MNGDTDVRWWEERGKSRAAGAERARRLFGAAQQIHAEEDERYQQLAHYLRLYGNRNIVGLSGGDFLSQVDAFVQELQLRYNVCESTVDTATSRIGKNKPKASFLTQGGNYTLQKQARRLEKYVEGVFHEEDMYGKGREVFRDAGIGGTGLVKWREKKTRHGWQVGVDRIFPWEVLVDKYDGRYGLPRQIYHIKYVDRRQLAKRWKIKPSELDGAASDLEHGEEGERSNSVSDEILVAEGWRLPSVPGGDDGGHSISISTRELFWEEWDEDWVPIVPYHWRKPVAGYWGTGIVRSIQGTQIEINRLLEKLQAAYQLFANPWVAVHRSSRVVKSHIVSGLGHILEYEGSVPPTVVTHDPINPQVFTHLEQLKRDAHDISGVSQMSAQNRKPADLESGAALREWNDIEDSRHANPALEFESWYMRNARVCVGMSRRMHEAKRSPSIMATFQRRSRKWVEPIKWSEVNISETSFVMRIYPTSTLPSTPAGRTATVEQWLKSNLISQDEARYLLDFPDLEAHRDVRLASIELVADALEEMLDRDHYVSPEPFQDLDGSVVLVQSAFMRAVLDKVPAPNRELLLRYLSALKRLQDIRDGRIAGTVGEAQQPAAPMVAPPGMAPPPVGPAPPPPGPGAGLLAALPQGAAA